MLFRLCLAKRKILLIPKWSGREKVLFAPMKPVLDVDYV